MICTRFDRRLHHELPIRREQFIIMRRPFLPSGRTAKDMLRTEIEGRLQLDSLQAIKLDLQTFEKHLPLPPSMRSPRSAFEGRMMEKLVG